MWKYYDDEVMCFFKQKGCHQAGCRPLHPPQPSAHAAGPDSILFCFGLWVIIIAYQICKKFGSSLTGTSARRMHSQPLRGGAALRAGEFRRRRWWHALSLLLLCTPLQPPLLALPLCSRCASPALFWRVRALGRVDLPWPAKF